MDQTNAEVPNIRIKVSNTYSTRFELFLATLLFSSRDGNQKPVRIFGLRMKRKHQTTKHSMSKKNKIYPSTLLGQGGKWLGTCRKWIQQNITGGDNIIWGDDDISAGVTPRQLEDLAAHVAAQVWNDCHDEQIKVLEMLVTRKEDVGGVYYCSNFMGGSNTEMTRELEKYLSV